MKKGLLAAAVLAAGTLVTAHAQDFRAKGFHAGLQTAIYYNTILDQGMSDSPHYDTDMSKAWKSAPIGLAVGYQGGGAGVQLEFNSVKNGQRYKILHENKKEIGVKEINMTSYQIPLLLKVVEGKGRAKFSFVMGPYLSLVREISEVNTMSKDTFILANTEYSPRLGNYYYDIEDPTDFAWTTGLRTPTSYSRKKGDDTFYKGTGLGAIIGLGTDVYLTEGLYASLNLRLNYQFTEMRSERDLSGQKPNFPQGSEIAVEDFKQVDYVQFVNANGVLKEEALAEQKKRTLLYGGFQLGLHYRFGK